MSQQDSTLLSRRNGTVRTMPKYCTPLQLFAEKASGMRGQPEQHVRAPQVDQTLTPAFETESTGQQQML